jgi:hypothetical protein
VVSSQQILVAKLVKDDIAFFGLALAYVSQIYCSIDDSLDLIRFDFGL